MATIALPWAPETTVYDISEFLLPTCDCDNPEIIELFAYRWEITAENGGVRMYYGGVPVDWNDVGKTLFLSREEAERRVQALKSGEDEWGNDLEKV